MIDPTQWRLRGSRLYGIKGDRSPLVLCRDLQFPLIRIDAKFNSLRPTARAGVIRQSFHGVQSGEQVVTAESRYYIFSAQLRPYSLLWNPITALPNGYLQIWEYIGTLSDLALNQLIAYSNGSSMPLFNTNSQSSETSTTTNRTTVDALTTVADLVDANPDRKGLIITNESLARLYLALGPNATATDYTAYLNPGDYWEMPFLYTGVVTGLWTAANGKARVTEAI